MLNELRQRVSEFVDDIKSDGVIRSDVDALRDKLDEILGDEKMKLVIVAIAVYIVYRMLKRR